MKRCNGGRPVVRRRPEPRPIPVREIKAHWSVVVPEWETEVDSMMGQLVGSGAILFPAPVTH